LGLCQRIDNTSINDNSAVSGGLDIAVSWDMALRPWEFCHQSLGDFELISEKCHGATAFATSLATKSVRDWLSDSSNLSRISANPALNESTSSEDNPVPSRDVMANDFT
jgi:hypothetical protein